MEITAHLRNYRQAPRKVRLITDIIRGKSVAEALLQLDVTIKRASSPVRKLLLSAVANAKHNHQKSNELLFIKSIVVNEGPVLKRMRPRARGSGAPIHKHTSHVSLVLGEQEPKEARSTKYEARNKSKKENV